MPKKTKEINETIEHIKDLLSPKKDKKESKKTNKKVASTSAKSKNTTSKTATKTKPASENKTTSTKKATPKKSASKKSVSKKAVPKKVEKKENKPTIHNFSPEYYDLPYKYNKTVVKILAQTPTNLFVYWEISDEDREKLKEQYGEYFFEITKPVLVIHNITMNYSFEIDINDFANSWYFHVNDSSCEYKIELGRRPIPINYNYMPQYNVEKSGPIAPVQVPFVYISSSNELEAPNDHILFNNKNKIYFRNVKTNQIIEKDVKDFPFIVKDNEFVNVYELYKKLYKDEIIDGRFDRMNPSSGNPSSGNLSSW
ncbi:MAG: DUF4912 domain-containing protein [Clostridia bacterium]